jgi:hypothetical protein
MIKERFLAPADKEWLTAEIANDPLHSKNGTTPDFFYEQDTRTVCFEDEDGPVFAVRYSNVLKADIQFCRKSASKRRIVNGFMESFPRVVANATAQGYRQILVNTEAPSLKRWCEKHLGFKHFRDDLSRMLAKPKP